MKKLFITLGSGVFLLLSSSPVLAYVMQSSNYRMQFDSVNSGGNLSTSTNYRFEDTVGEIASGSSTSSSFNLYGGYQQMSAVSTTISLSVSGDVTLSPSIGGISGGTADGSENILVSTNNSAGYSLQVAADNFPALTSGANSFLNYTPSVSGVPDFDWSVANTSSAFGFSAYGSDVVSDFLNDGAQCNVSDQLTSGKCWKGFSVSDFIISSSLSANSPANTTTTVSLRATVGSSHSQPSGSYSAHITVTAYTN
ncbi:MAG: hypothetical protein NT034_03260 [Candidatus Magasanikbacteria bacterium]|nr:hypothetical protein [Candidatus Magasanikbacteria bacterium]